MSCASFLEMVHQPPPHGRYLDRLVQLGPYPQVASPDAGDGRWPDGSPLDVGGDRWQDGRDGTETEQTENLQEAGRRVNFWVAFVIGALVGCATLGWSLLKRPIYDGHPIQGFAFAAVVGGLVFGTIIWLIAKAF
jgi:hypothetical protein